MFCVSWSIMKDRNAAWGERPMIDSSGQFQANRAAADRWPFKLRSDQTNFIENLCQTAQAEQVALVGTPVHLFVAQVSGEGRVGEIDHPHVDQFTGIRVYSSPLDLLVVVGLLLVLHEVVETVLEDGRQFTVVVRRPVQYVVDGLLVEMGGSRCRQVSGRPDVVRFAVFAAVLRGPRASLVLAEAADHSAVGAVGRIVALVAPIMSHVDTRSGRRLHSFQTLESAIDRQRTGTQRLRIVVSFVAVVGDR